MAAGGDIRAGKAFVELAVHNNLFLRGLDQASHKFKGFGISIAKIGLGVSAAFGGIATAVIGAMVPVGRFSDIYQNLLNRVMATNDAAAASTTVLASTMNELFAIAARARTPIEGLVELYSRLALAGKGIGLGQQGLLAITETISKAATVGGGSALSIEAALVQLSQIFGAGDAAKGIGQELRSLREQAPFLFKIMAQGLKKVGASATGTTGEMEKLASSGQLTARQIAAAIGSMSAEVEEKFGRTVGTISQGFVVLHNAAIKAFGELSKKAGFGEGVAGIVKNIAKSIEEYGKKIEPLVVRIADWIKKNKELVFTIAKVTAAAFVVGAAIAAIGVALAAVATFPITALFIAIGVAFAGATGYLSLMRKSMHALSDEMKELREKGDDLRELDFLKIERLRQLAGKGTFGGMNNDEVEEAINLVGELEKKYGDLGLEVGEVNGVIFGMAGAWKNFLPAAQKQTIEEINKEIKELQNNLENLNAAKIGLKAGPLWTSIFSPDESGATEVAIDEIVKKIDIARKHLDELRKRLPGIAAGDINALVGPVIPTPELTAEQLQAKIDAEKAAYDDLVNTAEDAQKELTKVEFDEVEKRLGKYEQEIFAIEKLAREKRMLLNKMWRAEEARPGGPREVEIAKLVETQAEIARRAEEAKRKVREEANKEQQEEFAKLAKKEADIAEKRSRFGEDTRVQEMELKLQIAEQAANAETAAGQEKIKRLKEELRDLEADLFRERELRQAAEFFDKDQAGFEGAKGIIGRIAELMKSIKVVDDVIQKFSSRGTFSPFALQGFDSGGAGERTARATEASAKSLKIIEKRPVAVWVN
jgi:tape measure domain-containing protein